ncbi:hypothetical protein PM082_010721 [Marasmius tenuissimus]|nr:hypothetical protein PM082_010721 [Marasmius tenuissimus]
MGSDADPARLPGPGDFFLSGFLFGLTPRYIFELLAGVRGIENKWRSVQMGSNKILQIASGLNRISLDPRQVYRPTILPSTPPTVPAAPVVLAPNKLEATPPPGFHYSKGQMFFLKDDNRYRAQRVYSMLYEPPLDGSADVEFLQRVILPPHAYPDNDDYNHTTGKYCLKPMQGVTPLIPGIPVSVNLHGKADESLTIAALFDMKSLEPFPEYPEIEECVSKLWDITWAEKSGGIPVYEMPGL